MIGNGSLPASKLGNRTWRIRACDVDEYVSNSCQNKPAYSITNLPELELETPEHPRLISLFSGCGSKKQDLTLCLQMTLMQMLKQYTHST